MSEIMIIALRTVRILLKVSSNFFNWHVSWCRILCQLQVYYILIRYLPTLWNGRCSKSSNHLFPYKVIAVLLTVVLVLYTVSSLACLFYYRKFVSLNSFHLFCQTLQPLPLWQPPVCSLYLRVCFHFALFICFAFWIPRISEMIQYLSLCLTFH